MLKKTHIAGFTLFMVLCLAWDVSSSSSSVGATGIVKVVTKPKGAMVKVGGKTYGPTPVFIELPVGQHQLVISQDGYTTVKRKVVVEKDKYKRTDVVFGRLTQNVIRVHRTGAGEPDAGPSTIALATSPPGLTVFMNGLVVPQPTPVIFDIRAGIYELTLEQDGQIVYRKTVFARAGKTLNLDIAVNRRRRIDDSDPWK